MSLFERKLIGKLPEYENAGIFDSGVRARFEDYLQNQIVGSQGGFAQVARYILYTLGISVMALGVILLISHNWDDFPKSLRLFFGFVPLILSAGLAIWYFWTQARRSDFWREVIPLLNTTGVITSIAVVCQVYHIESDSGGFIRIVIVLCALLPFLFNSGISAAINSCLPLFFIGVPTRLDNLIISSVLLALMGGFLLRSYWRRDFNPVKTFSFIVFAVVAPIACESIFEHWFWWHGRSGISLDEDPSPILVFSSFYGLLVAFLALKDVPDGASGKKSLRIAGTLLALITLLVFTTRHIYWHRHAGALALLDNWQLFPVFAVIWGVCVAHMWLTIKLWLKRDGDKAAAVLSTALLIGFLTFVLRLNYDDSLAEALHILANVGCVAAGIAYIAMGVRRLNFAALNVGVLTLGVFVMLKFFEDDFDLWLRGVAFIVFGAALILSNALLLRRRKERTSQS